jgi:hypothetical protein
MNNEGGRDVPRSRDVPKNRGDITTREAHERSTATFVPYYWEAYNEIVEPRRFDHYLIRKWGPVLGPLGFLLVKVLRDRCYHNPQTGVLRDECEVDLTDLAAAVGVSRATLVRELARNEALAHFIRRVRQFRMVDGRPQKDANAYQVCMDDPIHPSDLARYDDLRAMKELERQASAAHGGTRVKGKESYTAQSEPNANSYTAQSEPSNISAQSEPSDTKCLSAQSEPTSDYLPPDSLTKESLTPAGPANAPQPNGLPPGGKAEGEPEGEEGKAAPPELLKAWSVALASLEAEMTKPTFHAHVKTLQPLDLTGANGTDGTNGADGTEAILLVPSAFTREWLEKRHAGTIAAALSEALGREVTVRLTQLAPVTSVAPAAPSGLSVFPPGKEG